MWFTLHRWVGRYRNFSDTEIVMSVVKLNERFAVFIGRAMTAWYGWTTRGAWPRQVAAETSVAASPATPPTLGAAFYSVCYLKNVF